MSDWTSRDRIAAALDRQPADRVGLFESFWGDTQRKWADEGHVAAEVDLGEHFGFDLMTHWAFNMTADLDTGDVLLEEDDETKLVRNGNGAVMRWWKNRSGTPEHVSFTVTDRSGWEELIRPRLTDHSRYRERINFEAYRRRKARAAELGKFFCWAGVNVFELMHPVCGHEHMLVGMALDPDWVKDMCEVFTQVTIDLMEILFAEEGRPDGLFFYEDMGFKERPFMSPAMYREMIFPSHQRTFDYAHGHGMKAIMHSCGFIEPLLPHMVEAGLDCLQAMEVKAGMDLLRIKRNFGDRIALFGGLDIRTLETNDLSQVKAELDAKLPGACAGGGYILHTDHSVPQSVEYDTYRYFRDYGLKLGTFS